MAEIATLYEAEIGKITPFVVQELNDAMQTYPAKMIKEAIKEAVRQNVKKWSYISKILENWREEGRDGGAWVEGQSVETMIAVARGERESTKANKVTYQAELDRRGIKWKDP